MAVLSLTLELARARDGGDPYAFRPEPQEYLVRSEGGTYRQAALAWDPDLLADLQAVQQLAVPPQVVARLGDSLARFLDPAGWPELAARIAAASEAGQPVHLTVRAAAAELYALPWELLRLPGSGTPLGAVPGLLVRYAWPGTTTAPPVPDPRPEGGAVLLAWSAAAGRVPHRAHLAALAAAAARGHLDHDPERDVLPDATLAALDARLGRTERPVALLHLLCHGVATPGGFGLGLVGPGGDLDVVDPGRLARTLQPHAGHLRGVVLMACHSGNPGALGGHLGSVGQELHRAGIPTVVASRFPLSIAGSNRFAEAFYEQLLVGPASVEQALLAGRAALGAAPEGLDWASLQLYARPEDGADHRPVVFRPYRGLLSFDRRHARFFYGRDAERAEVLADLEALDRAGRPRFIVVAGASGTGKSSVVLAGAVTDLLADQQEAADPGADRLEGLLTQVRAALGGTTDPAVAAAIDTLSRAAPARGAGAWRVAVIRPGSHPLQALRSTLAAPRQPGSRLLLVVDQFEEVFTHPDPSEAQDFAARLWAIARASDSGISVVLTVRVDFLGHCGELVLDEHGLRLDKVAYDEAHRVFVAQLGAAQLRAAMERPAARVGLSLEPGLAERMLAEVEGEPGALPLLSYTLDLLWQRRRGGQLRQATYEELGGVVGALHTMADALVDGLGAVEQHQARRLLVRLVGLQDEGALDTRKRVELDKVRPTAGPAAAAFDRALAALVDARLLVRGEEGGAPTVEVAHEALIRKWERLRRWVLEDRDKLHELDELAGWVAQCEQYRTRLAGEQLARATAIVARHPADVDQRTRDLVQRSHAAARRRDNLLRAAALAGILLAFVFGGVAVWGWSAQQEATLAQREAENQAEQARIAQEKAERKAQETREALALAESSAEEARQAQADAERAEDEASAARDEAEAQSRNALAAAREAQEALTAASRSEAKALDTLRMLAVRELLDDPTRAAPFLREVLPRPDLPRWASDAWHVLQHPLSTSRSPNPAPASGLGIALAPTGARAAVLGASGSLGLVDLADPEHPTTTAIEVGTSTGPVATSPDGSRVAVADQAGVITVYDVAGARVLDVLEGHTDELWSLAFSPDGFRLASASRDGTARLWSVTGGGEPVVLAHGGPVWSATFSPGGDRIVTASADGLARTWSVAGQLLAELEVCTDGRTCSTLTTAFRADGTRVLVSGAGNVATVWDPLSGERQDLALHGSYVLQAAFNPQEPTQAATLTWRGLVRTWQVPDLGGATMTQGVPTFGTRATVLAYRGDGAQLAVGHEDGTIALWGISSTGRLVRRTVLRGHRGAVTALAFAPDGRSLTSIDGAGETRTWPVHHAELSIVVSGINGASASGLSFDATGEHLLASTREGVVLSWTLDGQPSGVVQGLTLPPPATQAQVPGVRAWVDPGDPTRARVQHAGSEPVPLVEHWGDIELIALSPDGRHAATAATDGTVRLWPLLDEAEIYARLQVLPACASLEDRQLFLGETPDQARAAATEKGCL